MALTHLHVVNFCQAGNLCRYLAWEQVDGESIAYCLKHAQHYYKQIRRDMKMYDQDLDERGDNCPGYLLLKHKEQGFDVDGKP